MNDAPSRPGAPPAPLSIRMAEAAARRLGYGFEIVDPFSRYLARVSCAERAVFVGAGRVPAFPINSATAAAVARDKAHAYELVAEAGFPVPRSRCFFVSARYADLRPPGRDLEDALAFADALGYPVFAKPNDASRGDLARSAVDRAALGAHLARIAALSPVALVQEYLRGRERRVFVLDGSAVFSYFKTPPALTGDGERTIRALLAEIDRLLPRKGLSALNPDDLTLAAAMSARGLGLDDVLPAGARLAFSERANLAIGGGAEEFVEGPSDADARACAEMARIIGLRLCAIDLVYLPPTDGRPFVFLEANANPSLHTLDNLGRGELHLSIWTRVLKMALE